jgi:transposase
VQTDGRVIRSQQIFTGEINLIQAFNELSGEVQVHLEASELAPWVRSCITSRVQRVVISHPRTNAWIAKDSNKSDKVDAFKLAELLRLGRVHEVYYSEDQPRREFKQLVKHYDDLTTQQAKLKVKLKARLRTQGVIIRGRRAYTLNGREEVLAQVSSIQMRRVIGQLYELLDQLRAQQHLAKQMMISMGKQFPEVARFQEVPGVGVIGACRFSAYIQTPHRFSSKRKLWRYCRLGISQRTSDGKLVGPPALDRAGHGRLKDVARKAFDAALRCHKENGFKRAYDRALAQTHNTVHARLTVMRKIVAVLRAMWLENAPYRDELG